MSRPRDAHKLTQEALRITNPLEFARRAALLQSAAKMVDRRRNPEFWAGLQGELGNTWLANAGGSLAESIERAIACFEKVISVFTQQRHPQDWGRAQLGLGQCYLQRKLGGRPENLERAILHLKHAEQALASDEPTWAAIQNYLGKAFKDRLSGEPSENLERSLDHYESALRVYTYEAFREGWAATQGNLGTTYQDRILGDPAENWERAIECHKAAATVYTREADSVAWAKIQNNLGTCYMGRILGERADNVEDAIKYLKAALEFRDPQKYPEPWARTQLNLAAAFGERIRGDRAENLESSLGFACAALTVFSRDAYAWEWSMCQVNLGRAYYYRIRGSRQVNLEEAIRCYTDSLAVRTREAAPPEWATTVMNLGAAFFDRIRGEREDNIEKSIAHYKAALTVFTRAEFPDKWSMIQNNLGTAYANRVLGSPADNLELAIDCHHAALTVRSRELVPEYWAISQNNLGNAYRVRTVGSLENNLTQAINCYSNALTVNSLREFPEQWTGVKTNLGIALHLTGRTNEAITHWDQVLSHYEKTLDSGADHQHVAEAIQRHADVMLHVLRSCHDWKGAVTLIERTKGVSLRWDQLRSGGVPQGLGAKEIVEYRSGCLELLQCREELRLEVNRPGSVSPARQAELRCRIEELSGRLHDLEGSDSRYQPTALAWEDLQTHSVEHDVVLIYVIATDDPAIGTELYVVGPDREATAPISCPVLARYQLQRFLFGSEGGPGLPTPSLQAASRTDGGYWTTYIAQRAGEGTLSSSIGFGWPNVLRGIMEHLSQSLSAVLLERLEGYEGKRIIFVPDRSYALLPLHALSVGQSNEILTDRFVVSYAPSASLWLRCCATYKPIPLTETHFVAVANPDGTLACAECEVVQVGQHFSNNPQIALQSFARRDWLLERAPRADLLMLSCHAEAALKATGEAAFLLAHPEGRTHANSAHLAGYSESFLQEGADRLTLSDVWAGSLRLKQGCVVMANGCETGMEDPEAKHEEHLAFPSALLARGAMCVVSTLWAVDELASAILMTQFFEMVCQGSTPWKSLQYASQRLRTCSKADAVAWLDSHIDRLASDLEFRVVGPRRMELLQVQFALKRRRAVVNAGPAIPFADCVHWAAFVASGG